MPDEFTQKQRQAQLHKDRNLQDALFRCSHRLDPHCCRCCHCIIIFQIFIAEKNASTNRLSISTTKVESNSPKKLKRVLFLLSSSMLPLLPSCRRLHDVSLFKHFNRLLPSYWYCRCYFSLVLLMMKPITRLKRTAYDYKDNIVVFIENESR